jgi:hypothetical protein
MVCDASLCGVSVLMFDLCFSLENESGMIRKLGINKLCGGL